MTLRRLALLLALLAGSVAATARADDWGALATVSSTLGMNAGRLCMAEGARGDLGCPTYAPSLTTAGDVSVTGSISAVRFIGDGSGLTGLSAANVSVTTGASGSLVYRDAYGSLVASSGLSISSTTGSVGIGAGAPANLANNSLYAAGSIQAGNNMILGDNYYLSWGNGNRILGSSSSNYLAFQTSSTEAMRIVSSGMVGIGTSAPSRTFDVYGHSIFGKAGENSPIRIRRPSDGSEKASIGFTGTFYGSSNNLKIDYTGGSAGIALSLQNIPMLQVVGADIPLGVPGGVMIGISASFAPSATLHVDGTGRFNSDTEIRGTVSATTVKLAESPANACTAATAGTIKFSNGRPFICRYP